jgi:hypothetical protein
VEQRTERDALDRGRVEAGRHREVVGEAGESLAMAFRRRVLRLHGIGQRRHDAVGVLHLGHDATESGGAPQPREQHGLVPGLGEEIVRAGVEALHDVVDARSAGDEDDRQGDGPRVEPKPPADLEAIDARQADVEEHDIGADLGDRSQAVEAIAGGDRIEAGALELRDEQESIRRVILDDEDERPRSGLPEHGRFHPLARGPAASPKPVWPCTGPVDNPTIRPFRVATSPTAAVGA